MIAPDIANWLAFGGLAFLVCSASVTFAFGLGRVFQRVGDLRADVDGLKLGEAEEGRARSSLREAFARFEARMEANFEHLDSRVAELTRTLAGRPGRLAGLDEEGRP